MAGRSAKVEHGDGHAFQIGMHAKCACCVNRISIDRG